MHSGRLVTKRPKLSTKISVARSVLSGARPELWGVAITLGNDQSAPVPGSGSSRKTS